MKKILLLFSILISISVSSQTPYQRVYTTLNTKCQNSACHNNGCVDFSLSSNNLYTSIFNVDAVNTNSVLKHEKLVKQQHPYYSFLLRKIAGSGFDTDLSIDANEGSLMSDVNGNQLSKKEIEFIRQWIMFGAKKTYSGSEPQPNYQLVSDFYDSLSSNGINRFLPKPPKPQVGQGIQLRMGPIFLPITGEIEQEYLEQQEVYFPYLPEVYKIEGIMNQQSHHFLLFKYWDTTSAVNNNSSDVTNMAKVTLIGNTSFDGDKDLTSSWQNDADLVLPTGTGLFWDQKTVLDMNYHIKNFNASFVLPCDFYFNVYFKPRNVSTIEMKSQLSQNIAGIFIPTGTHTLTYDDPVNSGSKEMRYLWMMAGHTHQWGTTFNIYQRDSIGNLSSTKLYDGDGLIGNGVYENGLGYWDWHHPPIEYWPDLLPVQFGKYGNKKAGLVSIADYNNTSGNILTFSTQTNGEMQLWYYMYTSQPLNTSVNIDNISFDLSNLNIYPNPNNGQFHLQYTILNEYKYDLKITDMIGNTIYTDCVSKLPGSYNESLNLSKLSSGTYFLNMIGNNINYQKEFIIR